MNRRRDSLFMRIMVGVRVKEENGTLIGPDLSLQQAGDPLKNV